MPRGVAQMHRNREPLLHTAVYLELCAHDLEHLKLLQTEVLTELIRSKLNVDRLILRQHLEALVTSNSARIKWHDEIRRRGLSLCALNCSGNPLAYTRDWQVTEKTFQLAEYLGVKKVIMMSGLPATPWAADVLNGCTSSLCRKFWTRRNSRRQKCSPPSAPPSSIRPP